MLLCILLRGHSDERDPENGTENRTWRIKQDSFHARFQQTNENNSPLCVRGNLSKWEALNNIRLYLDMNALLLTTLIFRRWSSICADAHFAAL